jgi:hypothetical protein
MLPKTFPLLSFNKKINGLKSFLLRLMSGAQNTKRGVKKQRVGKSVSLFYLFKFQSYYLGSIN